MFKKDNIKSCNVYEFFFKAAVELRSIHGKDSDEYNKVLDVIAPLAYACTGDLENKLREERESRFQEMRNEFPIEHGMSPN